VWAWNPRDLQSFESRPLAAGERDAVLTVPHRKAGRVRGVVRAVDGTPLESVDVSVALMVHDNGRGYRRSTTGRRVRTDERGEFDLGMVTCGSTRLHVSGAGVLDHGQPLEEAGWYEPRVERQCRFRFEAQETAGDAISLLDADGHRLRLYSTGFGSSFGDLRYPLARGRTPVLAASERACTLVVLHEGVEVGRWPVRLDPASIRVLTR
jgi:hypothetical protein